VSVVVNRSRRRAASTTVPSAFSTLLQRFQQTQ
jgi:hypothetical protein